MTTAQPFDPLTVSLGGTALVTASAGTGKTHAITTLLIRLLLERDLEIAEVLVVTFTEAATAELRGRIGERLRAALMAFRPAAPGLRSGDEQLDAYAIGRRATADTDAGKLERALRDLDQATVSTIHGFCHRTLLENAFDSGLELDTELEPDLGLLYAEVLHDFWASEVLSAPEPEVRAIEGAGYQPSHCHDLLDAASRHATARLLPGVVGDPFQAAIQSAQQCFDADEIGALLASHPGLQGRPSKVTGWLNSAAALVADPPQALPLRFSALALGIRKLASVELAKTYQGPPPEHAFFAACQQIVTAYHEYNKRGPLVVGFRKKLVSYLRHELPRRRREAGVLSFDDLLSRLHAALHSAAGPRLAQQIRCRSKAALIDEFQDTDAVQFEIFDAIFARAGLPLLLIGDPKQAIYAFRGADIFAFLRAAASFSGPRYTMGVNWRSDPGLIAAVSELFRADERRRWPLLLEGIEFPEVAARSRASNAFVTAPPLSPAPLEILFAAREPWLNKTELKKRMPRLIAREIAELLTGGAKIAGRPVSPGDVAVLTRSNAQCGQLEQALSALDIPAAVLTRESVFHAPEAAELERVLAAAAEPTDGTRVRTAMATELVGGTAELLAHMEEEPALWEQWTGRFARAQRIWTERGFIQMARALMAATSMQQRLLTLDRGERRLTNLLHLIELCHAASREHHFGPAALLEWLAEQQRSTTSADHAELRLESDRAAVTISTIHKSKGLQYPVVYVPYAFDSGLSSSGDALRFHDEAGQLCIDLGSLDWHEHLARAEIDEGLAESLRVLYVALTRAQHRATVVWTAVGDAASSALGYLLVPPLPPAGRPLCRSDLDHRFDASSDDELRRAIAARAKHCGGAIDCRPLDLESTGEPVAPPNSEAGPLEVRRLGRSLPHGWRSSSYSALIAGATTPIIDDREGRDRDEAVATAEALAPAADNTPAEIAAAVAAQDHLGTDDDTIPLADFPRGARVGHFFHEMLERLDFQDPTAIEPLVMAGLEAHRFDPSLASPACAALTALLATPLTVEGAVCTLGEVPNARRLNELAFRLPVGTACCHHARAGARDLSPGRLAAALRCAPTDALDADYPVRLEQLRFIPLSGSVEGYIDLVFEHGGRYFVVDYKTNHLGGRFADYRPARLRQAMSEGHYYLQYHLYALAVHRYLGLRLGGYDYQRHFGGVLYLFMRGTSPLHGGRTGVFFERPPFDRLEALAAALDGAAPEVA